MGHKAVEGRRRLSNAGEGWRSMAKVGEAWRRLAKALPVMAARKHRVFTCFLATWKHPGSLIGWKHHIGKCQETALNGTPEALDPTVLQDFLRRFRKWQRELLEIQKSSQKVDFPCSGKSWVSMDFQWGRRQGW